MEPTEFRASRARCLLWGGGAFLGGALLIGLAVWAGTRAEPGIDPVQLARVAFGLGGGALLAGGGLLLWAGLASAPLVRAGDEGLEVVMTPGCEPLRLAWADVRRVELRGDGDGRVVAIDVEGDLEELLARVDAAVPVRWMARLNRRLHPGFAPVTLPRFLLADPVARVSAALAAELAARRPPPPCAPTTAGLPPPGGATEERRGDEAPAGEGEGAPVGGEGAAGEGAAVEGATGEAAAGERAPAP